MEKQEIKNLVHLILMEIKNQYNDLTESVAHNNRCIYPNKLKRLSFTFNDADEFLKKILEGTAENLDEINDDVINLLSHSLKYNEKCLAIIKCLLCWYDYPLLEKITEYLENNKICSLY